MLEEIRSECFAEDVDLPDLRSCASWTEAAARAFFESGGNLQEADLVMASCSPQEEDASTLTSDRVALASLLRDASLDHLCDALANDGLTKLWDFERTVLITHLKERGVAMLERQQLATLILKVKTASALDEAAGQGWGHGEPGTVDAPLPPLLLLPPLQPPLQPPPPPPPPPPPMASKTAEQASDAAPPTNHDLAALLADLSLMHLMPKLQGASLASLAEMERAALLAALKARGMGSLSERQKLATAIGKSRRATTAAVASRLLPPRSPPGPPLDEPPVLPRPGAAAAARRVSVPPLPLWRALSLEELRRTAPLRLPGEWFGLPLPASLADLPSAPFGTRWLTEALRAAGTLDADDTVEAITSFEPLALQGLDAQGGAGEKAILTVRYAKANNGLHTKLFVKAPWDVRQYPEQRRMLSVQLGDGDGLELVAYQQLEGLLPVKIPRHYFGDLCRSSAFYILVTECIEYAPRGSTADGFILDWRISSGRSDASLPRAPPLPHVLHRPWRLGR